MIIILNLIFINDSKDLDRTYKDETRSIFISYIELSKYINNNDVINSKKNTVGLCFIRFNAFYTRDLAPLFYRSAIKIGFFPLTNGYSRLIIINIRCSRIGLAFYFYLAGSQ